VLLVLSAAEERWACLNLSPWLEKLNFPQDASRELLSHVKSSVALDALKRIACSHLRRGRKASVAQKIGSLDFVLAPALQLARPVVLPESVSIARPRIYYIR